MLVVGQHSYGLLALSDLFMRLIIHIFDDPVKFLFGPQWGAQEHNKCANDEDQDGQPTV